MANDKIDWSQYEVKDEDNDKIDWSQYEVNDQNESSNPIQLELTSGKEPEQNESTGILGVIGDLARGTGNAFKRGVKFAAHTPEMIEALGEELLKHPGTGQLRGAGQIGAEAAEIGKGIFNTPYNLNQYLARKHLLPQVIGKLGKLIPHIPEDTGLEKTLGLEEKEGDKFLRGLTEAATIGAGGVPIVKGIKNAVTAPSKQRLFKRTMESEIDKAGERLGLAEDELKQLKSVLRDEYSKLHPEAIGELSPDAINERINIKKQQLEANPKKNEIPEGELVPIPKAPDTEKMLEEHKNAMVEAEKAAKSELGVLNSPSLKAGGKIKKAIIKVHDTASDLYNNARNYYKEKKISADNSAEIKSATKELEVLREADELAPGYGSGTADQKSLEETIERLKGEKVNASDIFDLQRTLEKMAENTREKQFASGKGTTELERKRLGELAEKFDSHADKLAKRLESVGGKDVQKMIKEANKGWKIYKELSQGKYEHGVFKTNPVGRAALKSGNVPTDSLIKIASEYPSNDFLKALIDNDQELRKQLLAAYSGKNNLKNLMNPDETIVKHLNKSPEVQARLNEFKNAIANYESNKKSVKQIKKTHDEFVDSLKKVAEAKKLQQQIKFHEDAIPKIKEKMDKIDAASAEHAKLKKQLKEHEQHLADKNHLLKKYGSRALGLLGINELAKKLGF